MLIFVSTGPTWSALLCSLLQSIQEDAEYTDMIRLYALALTTVDTAELILIQISLERNLNGKDKVC